MRWLVPPTQDFPAEMPGEDLASGERHGLSAIRPLGSRVPARFHFCAPHQMPSLWPARSDFRPALGLSESSSRGQADALSTVRKLKK
jgi:hypothetical protein